MTFQFQLFANSHAGASSSEVPDYSNSPRSEVPEEYTWDLSHLFENLDAWEKEKERIVKLIGSIDEQASGWTESAQKMLAFYRLLDDIFIHGSQVYQYAQYLNNMELDKSEYQQMLGEIRFIFNQLQSKLSFVDYDLVQLGEDAFRQYLKDEPALKDYDFQVLSLLRRSEHILPPEQARIVSLSSLSAQAPSQASGALNNTDIPNPTVKLSDGKEHTLNYSTYARLRAEKNPADRQLVMDTFFKNIRNYKNTFSILLDGAMKRHVFAATVHNYQDTLTARMDVDNIDTSVYTQTVEQARAHLQPLHRHLQLKKKLLGLETFRYVDMYASAVKSIDRTYTWEEARELVADSLSNMGESYLEPFHRAFEERWIDRYPSKGKQSGAYSSGVYGLHPYVKMNFTGDFDNVSTLTHEMGHAMHSWFSNQTQPYAKHDYTIFLAEMASTFNEHMLIDHLLETEQDDLFKLYVLDNYLNGLRGTIYRQSLFAEFELEMHRRAEAGQTLTADWLSERYLDLTRFYYGHEEGVTEVGEYIAEEWCVIPHFFYNYYVIYYTTGIIASMALQKMVKKEGASGVEKYIEFLSSGASGYPLDILKSAGVDMTTDKPYIDAFLRLDALVSEMEGLVEALTKAGKI